MRKRMSGNFWLGFSAAMLVVLIVYIIVSRKNL